jgi:hypothetical protein
MPIGKGDNLISVLTPVPEKSSSSDPKTNSKEKIDNDSNPNQFTE